MSEPTTPPVDHSVKVTHLVFGLLFLGIAGVWALVAGGVITAGRITYLGPGVLIAAGVIGLAASLASTRNRRTREPAPYDPDQYDPARYDPAQYDPAQYDDTTEEIR